MYALKKVNLKIGKKSFKFLRDKDGYYFADPKDEKKYRESRNTFRIPLGNGKTHLVEEYANFNDLYRIGHIEMRNLAYEASTATIYYKKAGLEVRRILKDQSDIECAIEDGVYLEE